jgi:plastocyanin
MSCRTTAIGTIGLVLSMYAGMAWADPGNKESVTVSFGAGLNTLPPGNPANHHIVPPIIKVKAGGVVNFVVAGFHQIFVYLPGRQAEDIFVPASGTFINDLTGVFYQGLSPAGAPPTGFSNAQNRVESVSFAEPGTYLVICNVRGHFLNGMIAYVEVTGKE